MGESFAGEYETDAQPKAMGDGRGVRVLHFGVGLGDRD